jgi:hypothetical protein
MNQLTDEVFALLGHRRAALRLRPCLGGDSLGLCLESLVDRRLFG